jgi:AhpD family alkylhydroperoxidase
LSTPRILPGRRADVGVATWVLAALAGKAMGTRPLHLFLTLGRHRWLFRGWLVFAGRLMPGGRLRRRESELVILRVAHLRDCRYEFEHHLHLGRRAGVTAADVERVTAGPEAPGWAPREAALLGAVDELHADGDLGDSTWATLREHVDEPEAIELCMLAGHYEMLATVIAALRIQTDVR